MIDRAVAWFNLLLALAFGGAPEIFVSGISDISEVAPGVVRVSFYTAREDGPLLVCHQIWPASVWADSLNVSTKVWKEMKALRGQPKLVQAAGMH